ncbi:MAG: TSUP family transporter [Alphaproteobacteria bacterium]
MSPAPQPAPASALSGLTGTGGGIFLSPILLFAGWASTRNTSGIAAVFILCNSVAGLAGNFASVRSLPPALPVFAVAVFIGTLVGTTLGVRYRPPMILKALGVVLIIAGLKLIRVY